MYVEERCLTISAPVMMARNWGGGAKRCGKSSLRGGSQCENDDPVNQKGGYECNMFTKRGLKLGSHFWN